MRALHLFSLLCFSIVWIVSCQKEYSCENCTGSDNQSPIARAGSDQFIQLPKDSLLIDASGSFDTDGQISAYAWSVISGPTGYRFADSLLVKTVIKNLLPGSYQVQLKITDNRGAIAMDTMEIRVMSASGDLAPIAIAGKDQTILLPADSANLDGGSSFDQDGTIISFIWIQLDGPSQSIVSDINNTHTLVTGLQEGTYRFELKVTDNNGLSSTDTVQLQVLKPISSTGGFTFNLLWTCKDHCDDTDVFVSILEGFNLFADPNIPMEVAVMENNSWIIVPQYKVPLPVGSNYYYLVTQRTLFVYRAPLAGASSFIGEPVLVKVKFI